MNRTLCRLATHRPFAFIRNLAVRPTFVRSTSPCCPHIPPNTNFLPPARPPSRKAITTLDPPTSHIVLTSSLHTPPPNAAANTNLAMPDQSATTTFATTTPSSSTATATANHISRTSANASANASASASASATNSATTSAVAITSTAPPESAWVPHRAQPDVPIIGPGNDWISPLYDALQSARDFRPHGARHSHAPRVLVLYGTLRPKGFSKALAYECARLGDLLGLDIRVFNPDGLPVRDPELTEHPKVVELRNLVEWSEGHVWVASELHGGLCSVFKNQIDWIPLNTGSIRPTQGKCAVVLQVSGGSQSFNVVNALRLLARWMRMACVVNQSSVPMAWKQFDDDGRMKEGSLRERVVDVMEEFVKTLRINREYADTLTDRYSERKEKEDKGRLLTQEEKEAQKDATATSANKD